MADMLDDKIKQQVRELFRELRNPVTILFFGSKRPEVCQYCNETKQLLEEVSDLSRLLTLEVYDVDIDSALAKKHKVDGVPGFVLLRNEGAMRVDHGIRFKGIPAGHEFSSLVNSLMLVSRGDSNLSKESRQFLSDLKSPVHLQVFVTPT